MVVEVFDKGGGSRVVFPPANIIHTKEWARGSRRYTFVFVERPRVRPVALKSLANRLGRGAKKELLRNGRVGAGFAARLLAALGD